MNFRERKLTTIILIKLKIKLYPPIIEYCEWFLDPGRKEGADYFSLGS